MACNHRFIEHLYPEHELKYLFVGTFNPEWDNPNGNNANWFYGRRTNSFWNIMPRALGHSDLNNRLNRHKTKAWKQFCLVNKIGLTDMIEKILDADEKRHQNEIISFLDDKLEVFNQIKLTNVKTLIQANSRTLQGVYLTRYCHTLNPDGLFYKTWSEIQDQCKELGIHNSCLVTPSNGYMMTRDQKVELWRSNIIKV